MTDIKLLVYKVYYRIPMHGFDFEFVEAASKADAKHLIETKYPRAALIKVVRVKAQREKSND